MQNGHENLVHSLQISRSATNELENSILCPSFNQENSSFKRSEHDRSTQRKRNKKIDRGFAKFNDENRQQNIPPAAPISGIMGDVASVGEFKINQPFQRIVFDEAGKTCQVIPRTQQGPQVNRKQQKRLGTSNYNWSNSYSEAIPEKIMRYPEVSGDLSSARLNTRNLQFCVHRFPNDYDTVVNYWYTTLEWLDKATYEASMESWECKPDDINPIVDEITSALESDLTRFSEIAEDVSAEVGAKSPSVDSCSSGIDDPSIAVPSPLTARSISMESSIIFDNQT